MTPEEILLLKNLRDYQVRETRQQWSEYFELRRTPLPELEKSTEVICHLRYQAKGQLKNEYLFRYADGEVKYKAGSAVELYPENLPMTDDRNKVISRITGLNAVDKTITLQLQGGKPLHPVYTLMPGTPFNTQAISESIYKTCSILSRYPACEALFKRLPSRFIKSAESIPNIYNGNLREIITKAISLDRSHMTIQGPPGTGKTFTGARIILELLRSRRRVGIMAMSHKAVNNLLEEVDSLLTEQKLWGKRLIKSPSPDNPTGLTHVRYDRINERNRDAELLASTIFTFSRLPDAHLDTLIIDEAGQIPLAWIMAAGRTARNIILLGDQQQLPQVSQSLHPAGSGDSVLDHLMQDNSVIPEPLGFLLDESRRMHPHICQFISELMYNGKLKAHDSTEAFTFDLTTPRHPALKKNAIHCHFIAHSNRAQDCPEEAREIVTIINELTEKGFNAEQILIVCPYRAQEGLVRSMLPQSFHERIGTVDRFQGREADVVIFSMTSSDSENLPRDLEFLYSSHRLNVAVSRARRKMIVLASQKLLSVPAKTIKQARLINALCRLHHYSRSLTTE